MKTVNDKKAKTPFSNLFGQPTPAKASGLSFSLATILPVILSFFFLIVVALAGGMKEGYETQDWFLYANFLLTQISFVLVAFIYFSYAGGFKESMQRQKCAPRYFLIAFLLQVGLLSLSELNGWFLSFLEGFGYTDSGISLPSVDGVGFIGVLLVVAVFPAILEELIFRGVLLDGLKTAFGTGGCVLVCGALFALYHQNPAQTAYQFCCGVAFALVAIRSGSILPTVLSHFLNNLFILIMYKCNIEQFAPPVFIAVLCVSVCCLIGSLVWLLCFDKEKTEKRVGDKAKKKQFFLYALVGIFLCVITWLSVFFAGV